MLCRATSALDTTIGNTRILKKYLRTTQISPPWYPGTPTAGIRTTKARRLHLLNGSNCATGQINDLINTTRVDLAQHFGNFSQIRHVITHRDARANPVRWAICPTESEPSEKIRRAVKVGADIGRGARQSNIQQVF
jgi:hypothetical protein